MSEITKKIIGGYVYIKCKYHPNSNKGYVAEHRIVIERFIGRYLKPLETVHHINGNKRDNMIRNLYLFNNHNEHRRFENKVRQFGFTNPIINQINHRWDVFFEPIIYI